MSESLILAKLTLMLLRASIPLPERLPVDHSVIVLPSQDVLAPDEALVTMSRLDSGQLFMGAVKGSTLVVSARHATDIERQRSLISATTLEEAISRLNKEQDPDAQVRVVGFREEILVSQTVVRKWLWSTVCDRCSMSVGRPLSTRKSSEIAVLYLGQWELMERPNKN